MQKQFWIVGDIEESTLFKGQEILSAARDMGESGEIIVVLSSSGGDIYPGLGLYDILRDNVGAFVKITTVVVGYVASMAVPIFLAGDERIITPSSFIKLHEMGTHFNSNQRWSLSEWKRESSFLQGLQDRYIQIIQERSGMPPDHLLAAMKDVTVLNAKESTRHNLATKIGKLPV